MNGIHRNMDRFKALLARIHQEENERIEKAKSLVADEQSKEIDDAKQEYYRAVSEARKIMNRKIRDAAANRKRNFNAATQEIRSEIKREIRDLRATFNYS